MTRIVGINYEQTYGTLPSNIYRLYVNKITTKENNNSVDKQYLDDYIPSTAVPIFKTRSFNIDADLDFRTLHYIIGGILKYNTTTLVETGRYKHVFVLPKYSEFVESFSLVIEHENLGGKKESLGCLLKDLNITMDNKDYAKLSMNLIGKPYVSSTATITDNGIKYGKTLTATINGNTYKVYSMKLGFSNSNESLRKYLDSDLPTDLYPLGLDISLTLEVDYNDALRSLAENNTAHNVDINIIGDTLVSDFYKCFIKITNAVIETETSVESKNPTKMTLTYRNVATDLTIDVYNDISSF
ncbi:MAG: hypothetical protein KatS3mg003_1064 [Candidatus Nitrosocaldaceae archaeon]|nr:MAG: hypothetical protein KatS3mg003_1064 [Candidatus Nitrosocaldaceae archaeon]